MAAATALVAAAAITAYSAHKSQKSKQKHEQTQAQRAQAVADKEYADQMAWRESLMSGTGVAGDLFQRAIGPQTTTSSSTTNEEFERSGTTGLVKTPELLATRTRAAQAAGEVAPSLSGMLQSQYGQIAGQEERDLNTLRNALVSRGGNPEDVRLAMIGSPAARAANQARLDARFNVNQELYGRQRDVRQEQASIEQMLADQFSQERGTSSSRTRGSSTGPGNYGAALAALAPPKRDVYL